MIYRKNEEAKAKDKVNLKATKIRREKEEEDE